ncbi:MAG: ATP-binding cassette domain-containing protein [Gammaproteobacteria bacterium]
MLILDDLSLYRGPRLLFKGASLSIFPGHKVGLTGANGTGKSSLFALIRGELKQDAGEFSLPPGWVIAHVAQEMPAVDTPAIDYVLAGDEELDRLQGELQDAEAAHDGTRLADLHAHLDAIDGYTAGSRAAKLMHGLGFSTAQENAPLRSFSGGWRMRLNLARALMCRSDLLLLDEPTNHLDLDAVLWLEDWLRAYPGTLLLISHDRDFLDTVAGHILHIANQQLQLYNGNYSAFERRHADQLAAQQAAYAKQQSEIARMRGFVDRFRAQATKARQAQSRLKALERMERIAPAHVDSPFTFTFRDPKHLPHPLLRLEDAAAGYAGCSVIGGVDRDLVPGERLGLLGPNGAGKSTLIKLLAGELAPLAGARREATGLRIGYFAQHQLEQLRPQDTPLQHLSRLDPKASEQSLRDFLGGFGFLGDDAFAPVVPFSGGEKARLVLALLVYQRPNLLLLDEPTNHLDLEMRHALDMALQTYHGALVLVSHDRYLLRTVCDRFVLVTAGRAIDFDGDLDDYRHWLAQRDSITDQGACGGSSTHSAEARKTRRRNDAERRRRLKPLKAAVERWEASIAKLESQRDELQRQLAAPDLYMDQNKEKLRTLLNEQPQVTKDLADAETRWLEASEALEAAEGEL